MKPKVQIVTLEIETDLNKTQLKEDIRSAIEHYYEGYPSGLPKVRQITVATAQAPKKPSTV